MHQQFKRKSITKKNKNATQPANKKKWIKENLWQNKIVPCQFHLYQSNNRITDTVVSMSPGNRNSSSMTFSFIVHNIISIHLKLINILPFFFPIMTFFFCYSFNQQLNCAKLQTMSLEIIPFSRFKLPLYQGL